MLFVLVLQSTLQTLAPIVGEKRQVKRVWREQDRLVGSGQMPLMVRGKNKTRSFWFTRNPFLRSFETPQEDDYTQPDKYCSWGCPWGAREGLPCPVLSDLKGKAACNPLAHVPGTDSRGLKGGLGTLRGRSSTLSTVSQSRGTPEHRCLMGWAVWCDPGDSMYTWL